MTLDPPGTIAVIGAGALGIEAAMYGRFLGYDVTLLEAESVGSSMRDRLEAPLPMLPDRCLSPLAMSALQSQSEGRQPTVLPLSCGQWIGDALVPLTQTDLLAGRLRMPARVTEIIAVAVEPEEDETDEDVSDIPADFRLTLADNLGVVDAEAVVLSIGTSPPIPLGFELPIPYFFQIGQNRSDDAERDLHDGLRQIVQAFAQLAGRADLDLYRPLRH